MVFGGIPYYLGYMDKELSLAQNIDNLFFSRNAVLKNEYDQLFESVFTNPEAILSIVDFPEFPPFTSPARREADTGIKPSPSLYSLYGGNRSTYKPASQRGIPPPVPPGGGTLWKADVVSRRAFLGSVTQLSRPV